MSRVKRITVRNVLGIEELEIEPGNVTIVEGGNGMGKTSFVEALLMLVGNGYDATLVRDGADQAEIVVVLDDETTIQRRIRRTGGGDTKVSHPDFGTIGAPQSFLGGITDALSFNPVAFLTAKDRGRAFLETLPMEVTREELSDALDNALFQGLQGIRIEGRHALEVLDEVRKRAYDERTAVNRTARDKKKTAEGLRDSVPDGFDSPTVLENQLADARGAHRDAEAELTRKLGAIKAAVETTVASMNAALNQRITDLKEQIRDAERETEATIRDARAGAAQKQDDFLMEVRPKVNSLGATATRLEEQLRVADAHANTRAIMEEAQEEATMAEASSEKLTAAIGRLDALKDRLVAQIPIDGVTVKDGEVFVDGHPFGRVNRARQVRVAVQLAGLRAGKLPLVCVDGLECLEREVFDVFVQELEHAGLQAFVTRVTEGPLRIRTSGVAAAVEA